MKASFVYGPRDVRVQEISDVEPGPGQVLLEVTAVGICGSDLHTFLLGNVGGTTATEPITLGHEAAGRILALGPGVEGLHIGQRVAIDPANPCGQCERCQAGEPHLCERIEFIGLFPFHGAMRERMIYPARLCVPMPDRISDIGAALLEPLGVTLHASRLAEIQIGDDVAVLGAGAIGLLLIRLARLAGARRIFAADRHPWRLNLAAAYGADQVIDARDEDVVEAVRRATHGRGVDVAFEAAWIDQTAQQCLDVTRHGGRVVLVGIPAEDELHLRPSVPRHKELTIRYSRRMKHVYPAAIELAVSGQVDLDRLATHQFTLDQTPHAFLTAAEYADGVVRAIVLPNGPR
ncbi:MAG: alcohol dehydrogenase catalytic domain-containing protein [Anaerolineae bacterium]|nr:alcohol dehydrogenase catalytic domain-containing protein [Anaerolineae bacterium]